MRHTCRHHREVQRMKSDQKIEVDENGSIHMVFETSSRYTKIHFLDVSAMYSRKLISEVY